MKPIFSCVIPGRCVTKKNSQKVIRAHGNTRVVYSKQFKAWEAVALPTLRFANAGNGPIDLPLEIKLVFSFKNRSSEADLSNLIDGPQDVLTKAGVIIDDRIIQVIHARKEFTGVEETHIELYAIEAS